MKSKNMLLVAQDIEDALKAVKKPKPKVGFNMISYIRKNSTGEDDDDLDLTGNECGTTCCIGGFAAIRALGLAEAKKTPVREIRKTAQKFLGLNEDDAQKLFCPDLGNDNLDEIQPTDAIASIRVSAAAKKITWVRVRE